MENAVRAKEGFRVTGHGLVHLSDDQGYDVEAQLEQQKRIAAVRGTGNRFIILAATAIQFRPLLRLFEDAGLIYSRMTRFFYSQSPWGLLNGSF